LQHISNIYTMSSADPSSPANTPPSSPSSSSNTTNTSSTNTSSSDGYVVTNQQYTDSSGNEHINTQFNTTDPTSDVQITQDLSGEIIKYDNDTTDSAKVALIAQIQTYANDIKCTSFQGKGSIDDYTQLFQAAAQIANESAQMQLDVDIEGFNEFANAADDLSKLFTSFILKLENVSIIDDTEFLTAVANALSKISNLSKVFGKFKETILATSTIHLPKSTHDASVILRDVISQVNCAMTYINHFVDSTIPAPSTADLSPQEKNIIDAAVTTINNWNILCDQGVSIAMSNDPDIQSVASANQSFRQKSQTLTNATALLRSKLAAFNMGNTNTP